MTDASTEAQSTAQLLATLPAALADLSDASDSTYLECNQVTITVNDDPTQDPAASVAADPILTGGVSPLSVLSANINHVVIRAKVAFMNPLSGDAAALQLPKLKWSDSSGNTSSVAVTMPENTPAYVSSGEITTAPDGGPWTLGKVNDLKNVTPSGTFFQDQSPTSGTYSLRIYEWEVKIYGYAIYNNVWISDAELDLLPITGTAWTNLRARADEAITPTVNDFGHYYNMAGNQDSDNDIRCLAKALCSRRLRSAEPTASATYRDDCRTALLAAIDTEFYHIQHPSFDSPDSTPLAISRNMLSYVAAADLVGFANVTDENNFKAWIARALNTRCNSTGGTGTNPVIDGGVTTLVSCCDKPNNFASHALASRLAAAFYLSNSSELATCLAYIKGYLGDRTSHAWTISQFGTLEWQYDETKPVSINQQGAVKLGKNIDGALPEEMRRGGTLQFWVDNPGLGPKYDTHIWLGTNGITTACEMLHRKGYPAFDWSNGAIVRMVQFLYTLSLQYPNKGWWSSDSQNGGDDNWVVWIVNKRYGSAFPAGQPADDGKNMAFTDWTHGPLA